MSEPTLGAILMEARRRLREKGVSQVEADLRVLAAHVFELDAAGLIARGGDAVSPEQRERFALALERRLSGVPVHRIIGRRAFYAHEFALSPETLEPRPDTEALVELAAEAFRAKSGEFAFADVGTGTGAIAVSLLALFPVATCLAIDVSEGALVTARENARAAGVGARFAPVLSDYLGAVEGPLDAVVSNPPYIPSEDIAGLDREVREHDPRLALDGGADGLDAYRRITAQAASRLKPDGDLLFEIGAGQERDVAAIAASHDFVLARSAQDLGGHVRALWFRRVG